jgi:hypothetical protein
VEYSKVKDNYSLFGFETEATGNLYTFASERALVLMRANGRFGFIIPLGAFATGRMSTFHSFLQHKLSLAHISYYSGDAHPSVLFSGVKYRLAIITGLGGSAYQQGLYTSNYIRWYAQEREELFEKIYFERVPFKHGFLQFARLGSIMGIEVLKKIVSLSPDLSYHLRKTGQGVVHYHRSPVFWIRAMDFEPYFKSVTRTRSDDHLRDLFFETEETATAIGGVLNSTLFFFWFISQGSCRDVTNEDIFTFPLGKISGAVLTKLGKAYTALSSDLKKHSKTRVYEYEESGRVEYQEFYPRLSKGVIDQIDTLLAQHYGFTPEELDYIINYDIKYRMGGELDAGEEES